MQTSTVAGDICVWPDAALSTPLITVPCMAAASNVAGSRQPGIDSAVRPLLPAGLAEAAAGPALPPGANIPAARDQRCWSLTGRHGIPNTGNLTRL
jgi:hypothetical protein